MTRLATPMLAAFTLAAADPPPIDKLLDRLSEEAAVFSTKAQAVVARERLLHRGRKAPPRFKLRVGVAATERPNLSYVEREVISEFGFAAMKDRPGVLQEFRKVVRVDQREVREAGKARLELAMNMTSDNDRERKRLLQEFEKHGMVGAATDFAPSILLFQRGALKQFTFELDGEKQIGVEPAWVVRWKQLAGAGAAVFHGREMSRVRMKGEVWFRQRDLLPVRIRMEIPTVEEQQDILHTGEIDYYQSKYGLLLPSAVRYRKTLDATALVENFAFYNEYKMFAVETEIKFTPSEVIPEDAQAGPSK